MEEPQSHLMIDLETFGLENNAPIWQAGFVVFDNEKILYSRGFLPTIQSQQDYITYSASTMDWWIKQKMSMKILPDQDYLKEMYIPCDIVTMINSLRFMIQNFKVKYVWANSPSFDLKILSTHCKKIGQEVPWRFWQEMDVRPFKNLLSKEEIERIREGQNLHDAVTDCVLQIEMLLEVFLKYGIAYDLEPEKKKT